MKAFRAVISYHFFAHYRESIIRELSKSRSVMYQFVGDKSDPGDGTIRSAVFPDSADFIETRTRRIFGPFLWQSGIIGIALRTRASAIVFLGNMYMPATWISALISRIRGIRVLFWSHGWRTKEKGPKRFVRLIFYRLADSLLVYEHHAKNIAIDEGFPSDQVHVVYNSLNLKAQQSAAAKNTPVRLSEIRKRLFGNDAPVVMCSSRLIAARRIDLLIEAVAFLNKRGFEANLLIVGDGPAKHALTALAEAQGVNACFFGACYDEDVLAGLFGVAAVTASPGPIGLMVIHSFAYGVPVVASNRMEVQGPEWGAIIAGKNGGFFVDGDAKSLALELENWIGTNRDREVVAEQCMNVVKTAYNARYQSAVIDNAVLGGSADDTLRCRWLGSGDDKLHDESLGC